MPKFDDEFSIWMYLGIVAFAVWGGTTNYVSRMKRGLTPFSIPELLGEWLISGFAGMASAYGCLALGYSFELTMFCAGIAGHMGGRLIFIIETLFVKRLTGKDLKQPGE